MAVGVRASIKDAVAKNHTQSGGHVDRSRPGRSACLHSRYCLLSPLDFDGTWRAGETNLEDGLASFDMCNGAPALAAHVIWPSSLPFCGFDLPMPRHRHFALIRIAHDVRPSTRRRQYTTLGLAPHRQPASATS